jgi:hypothetical protein
LACKNACHAVGKFDAVITMNIDVGSFAHSSAPVH